MAPKDAWLAWPARVGLELLRGENELEWTCRVIARSSPRPRLVLVLLERTVRDMSHLLTTALADARLHRLLLAAAGLGDDEIALLELIATRLAEGRRIYGPLHLDQDGRDFQREALEEVADALVYVGAALARRARRRVSRG